MAQATLVSMNIPPSKGERILLLGSLPKWEGPYPLSMSIRLSKVPPATLLEFAFLIRVCEQRPLKEP
jgi:hypothetical protein